MESGITEVVGYFLVFYGERLLVELCLCVVMSDKVQSSKRSNHNGKECGSLLKNVYGHAHFTTNEKELCKRLSITKMLSYGCIYIFCE